MHNPKEKSMPTQTNQSSDKLLTVLEVLAEQSEPVRLQDLAGLCHMNASTTLRFLTALQRRDYVAQEMDTGRYFLTLKLCGLAENISGHLSVRNLAMPFMRSVAQIFSETCNLAVENDMALMYIETANAPNKMLMSTQRIGNIAPLHCTGVGKLLLAGYTRTKLEQVIALKGLQRFTEYTITDLPGLERELQEIRERGYAFDNQECEVGARCIAAPIRDYTGEIVAGISVSGPSVRMTDEHIYTHLPFLLENARQLSTLLGWQEGVAIDFNI